MITLLTKDGTKTGNAIIYGGADPFDLYEFARILDYEMKPVFLVETDFGNKMKLTWSEIEEMFTVGKVCDYQAWKADRARLQEEQPEEEKTSVQWRMNRDHR